MGDPDKNESTTPQTEKEGMPAPAPRTTDPEEGVMVETVSPEEKTLLQALHAHAAPVQEPPIPIQRADPEEPPNAEDMAAIVPTEVAQVEDPLSHGPPPQTGGDPPQDEVGQLPPQEEGEGSQSIGVSSTPGPLQANAPPHLDPTDPDQEDSQANTEASRPRLAPNPHLSYPSILAQKQVERVWVTDRYKVGGPHCGGASLQDAGWCPMHRHSAVR